MSVTTERLIRVVAGFLERDGKVLLVKRPSHKKRGGLWEFPGGKIEEGESPEEALARELKEELGIEIIQSTPIAQLRYSYPDEEIELNLLKGEFLGKPIPNEAEELAWIPIETLENINLCPADKELVKILRKNSLI